MCQNGFIKHFNSIHKGKKLQCKHCDKSFPYISSLNRHVECVYDGKIFRCSQCDKDFVDSSGLIRHKKSKHKMIKYQCEICDKGFIAKDKLRKHCLSQHGNVDESKNLEPNTTQKLVSSSIKNFTRRENQQVMKRKIQRGQWIVKLEKLKTLDFINFPGISL